MFVVVKPSPLQLMTALQRVGGVVQPADAAKPQKCPSMGHAAPTTVRGIIFRYKLPWSQHGHSFILWMASSSPYPGCQVSGVRNFPERRALSALSVNTKRSISSPIHPQRQTNIVHVFRTVDQIKKKKQGSNFRQYFCLLKYCELKKRTKNGRAFVICPFDIFIFNPRIVM